jgi:glycerol dehydrogenase-like iron-containing ADH family enzyme
MGRAWTGAASRARDSVDQNVVLGAGSFGAASAAWGRYLAVTGRRAWAAAGSRVMAEPAAVVFPEAQHLAYVEAMVQGFPPDLELVVAVGGGLVLDVAKYFSVALDLPLVMAPTIVSSGATVHSWGGGIFAEPWRPLPVTAEGWSYSDPEAIIIDPDLILPAPEHLNTAGLGDTFCRYAGAVEWKHRWERGIWDGPAWDDASAEVVMAMYDDVADRFRTTLDDQGRLSAQSLEAIVRALQLREPLRFGANLPRGDHVLEWYLGIATGKSWIHGELAALGAVIITWHCDQSTERLIGWLDGCKVRWRPTEQGLAEEELRRGLERAPSAFTPGGEPLFINTDTILRNEPIVGERFEQVWHFLTTT